jgi:hypothetical protein
LSVVSWRMGSTMGNRWIQIRVVVPALIVTLVCGSASAQKSKKPPYDPGARATLVHPAIVYVSAEDSAAHVTEVLPGHEVVVMERNGAWIRVFANTDAGDEQGETDKPEFSDDQAATPESGWIRDKGVVAPATVNGDLILFGTAANFEEQA